MEKRHLSRKDLIGLYRTMITIRAFEESLISLSRRGLVYGNMHLYIGMEAIAAGVMHNLTEEDMITSTHRSNGHLIAKGADMGEMIAEMMGKNNGINRGYAGKMHMTDPKVGIMGANAIVGAGIPLAAGHALFSSMYNPGQVTVCFFGDGAVNQGYFHEGINLAALWNLPVVFICENNKYAISSNVATTTSSDTIYQRAKSYDIPGVYVDGNDVQDVAQQSRIALNRAREGKGPTLIECDTYRVRGHHEGDDLSYRSKDEPMKWRGKCPIISFKGVLENEYGWSKENERELKEKVNNEIEKAIKFGEDGEPMLTKDMEKYLFNRGEL